MPRPLLVVAFAACVLAGCQDPYQRTATPASRPPRTSAGHLARTASADLPADTAPPLDPGTTATAQAAVGAFCAQWINWSWHTIERQQRRLSALAAGPLARKLAAQAALFARRPPPKRGWLAARGRVLSVKVLPGARVRAGWCVALEQQPAEGEGARSGRRGYLATVVRSRRGWALTRWLAQS